MAKNKKQKSYIDSVHSWGRISSITALCALLMFPVAICLYLNVFPDFNLIWKGLLKLIPTYWTVAVVEVIVYTPMLGAGGTYLSFVTGNIANLKLPCAISAMEGAKVKANSEEGEVISTIAIATSAIVTTIVLAIGIIAFAPFLDSFTKSPLLQPAFKMVLPALFGALGVVFISKNWKIAIAPIALMLFCFIFLPFIGTGEVGIMVPVGVVFTLIMSRILYKKGKL